MSSNLIDLSELFYVQIGSTVILDNLYLGLIGPLAFISLVLNSISYLVFSASNQDLMQEKKELKFYLKIYCLFSILMSLLAIVNPIISAPRYFSFVFTYWASFYRSDLLFYIEIIRNIFLNLFEF